MEFIFKYLSSRNPSCRRRGGGEEEGNLLARFKDRRRGFDDVGGRIEAKKVKRRGKKKGPYLLL